MLQTNFIHSFLDKEILKCFYPYRFGMEHSMENALPCIVCKKQMKNVPGVSGHQPDNGLEFITYGHYGSTVFDPVTRSEKLVICVCDDCVSAAAKDGRVAIEKPYPITTLPSDHEPLRPFSLWHPD